jgi:hypothetical protein
MCYKCKLSKSDLDCMTIGMCLDYIEEYIELENPKKKKKPRRAKQSDFDAF